MSLQLSIGTSHVPQADVGKEAEETKINSETWCILFDEYQKE